MKQKDKSNGRISVTRLIALVMAALLMLGGITTIMLLLQSCASARNDEDTSVDIIIPSPSVETAPIISFELIPQSTPYPLPAKEASVSDALHADGNVYTVAWISDPQHYSDGRTHIFKCMVDFIVERKDDMNLVYIVHTGDTVDSMHSKEQWAGMCAIMDELDAIPYGILGGNHDVGTKKQDYSVFSSHFGREKMKSRRGSEAYYGGDYQDNRGHYDLVTIGGMEMIFVYMSYAPDDACIKWMDKIVKAHSDRIAVLCLHDYFKTDMTLSDSGEQIFERVVKKNKNVYMVMCGHRYNIGCKAIDIDDDGDGEFDRRVYQLMSNYQAAGEEGGSGYMHFLRFDMRTGEIHVISYSPYIDDRRYHDTPGADDEKYPVDPNDEEYSFKMPWPHETL